MKAPAIQNRSDHRGILEGLRAELPILRQALGDERFERFALDLDRGSWPDFVTDLARLERAFNEVFFGPGVGAGERLDPATVDALEEEELQAARLEMVDSSLLLALRYPVVAYFEAARAGLAPSPPAAAATFALVLQTDHGVTIHRISRPEFVVLGLLKGGETVGDALAVVDAGAGAGRPLGTTLRSWLADWSERGLFTSVSR